MCVPYARPRAAVNRWSWTPPDADAHAAAMVEDVGVDHGGGDASINNGPKAKIGYHGCRG